MKPMINQLYEHVEHTNSLLLLAALKELDDELKEACREAAVEGEKLCQNIIISRMRDHDGHDT